MHLCEEPYLHLHAEVITQALWQAFIDVVKLTFLPPEIGISSQVNSLPVDP